MALDRTNTPSPDGGCAESDNPSTGQRFAQILRDHTNRRVDNGEIGTIEASQYYATADFCQQHNCLPSRAVGNFFNFGEFDVLFEDADGPGHWMSLVDLLRISGMERPVLDALFEEELADGSTQVAELKWLVTEDGDYNVIRLARHPFCMLAMAEGPWQVEFMKNLAPLMRRGFVESGLAKRFGTVAVVHEDGTVEQTDVTLEEFLGERLVDEDEARRQAFAGPLGGAL